MNDRIKLAEAMGITDHRCVNCEAQFGFDPFTDANDDYAVLEWARNPMIKKDGWPKKAGEVWAEGDQTWRSAYQDAIDEVGNPKHRTDYQIGDYARAALKVIDGD